SLKTIRSQSSTLNVENNTRESSETSTKAASCASCPECSPPSSTSVSNATRFSTSLTSSTKKKSLKESSSINRRKGRPTRNTPQPKRSHSTVSNASSRSRLRTNESNHF